MRGFKFGSAWIRIRVKSWIRIRIKVKIRTLSLVGAGTLTMEGRRLKIEPWKVADCITYGEEDPDPHLSKEWIWIRIKVIRIRNPAHM
jgi:hypothetical protein